MLANTVIGYGAEIIPLDQIVRTDLKELVDLDLQGKVYGYAPMGDDKPEMEGFRFWKTG